MSDDLRKRLEMEARARARARQFMLRKQAEAQAMPQFEDAPKAGMEVLARSRARVAAEQSSIVEETRGDVVPIGTTESGKVVPTMSHFMNFIQRVATMSGEVERGDLPIYVIDSATGETVLNPDVIDRATEAAFTVAGPSPKSIRPPTSEELVKVGAAGFDRFRALPIRYSNQALRDAGRGVLKSLADDGINERTAPATFNILKRIVQKPGQPNMVDVLSGKKIKKPPKIDGKYLRGLIDEIQGVRKKVVGEKGEKDGVAVERLVNAIYKMIEEPNPGTVIAGDSALAAQVHAQARQNWQAGKKSGVLTDKIISAELRAAVQNSGQNVGNKTRQKAAAIVDPDVSVKQRFGFTGDEIQVLDEVARGTLGQNITRSAGKTLGGGGGFSRLFAAGEGATAGGAIGFLAGGPPSAAVGATIGGIGVPLVGATLKGASARSSKKMMNLLALGMRMSSPMYQNIARKSGRIPALLMALGYRSDAAALAEQDLLTRGRRLVQSGGLGL